MGDLWIHNGAFNSYKSFYLSLLNGHKMGVNPHLVLREIVQDGSHSEKFLELFPKKPAILLVRDPVSQLKSVLNTKQKRFDSVFEPKEVAEYFAKNPDCINIYGKDARFYKDFFTLSHDPQKIFDNRIRYNFVVPNSDKPNMDDAAYIMDYRALCFHDAQLINMLKNVSEIEIIDMSEICGDRAFETMSRLSLKYGFNPPKAELKEAMKQRVADTELHLPIGIYAHENDIKALQNGINKNEWANDDSSITDKLEGGFYIILDTKFAAKYIDISSQFFSEDISPFAIKTDKIGIEKISSNPILKNAANEYAKLLLNAVKAKLIKEKSYGYNEAVVLQYLKDRPKLAKHFVEVIENHLKYLRAHKPEIISGWKHYAKLREIVEGFDD